MTIDPRPMELRLEQQDQHIVPTRHLPPVDTTPSPKTPKMERTIDAFTKQVFGRCRTDSIKEATCVSCGASVKEFKDAISRKEFTISGLCQSCQDGVFDSPPQ